MLYSLNDVLKMYFNVCVVCVCVCVTSMQILSYSVFSSRILELSGYWTYVMEL